MMIGEFRYEDNIFLDKCDGNLKNMVTIIANTRYMYTTLGSNSPNFEIKIFKLELNGDTGMILVRSEHEIDESMTLRPTTSRPTTFRPTTFRPTTFRPTTFGPKVKNATFRPRHYM